MTVQVGTTLSHYRINSVLGAGGMGVVYRASDERLKRDVAIKVIAPDRLGSEEARRRFRNEALALSKLNHPNIQIVYDFDSNEGVDFLVTEYIPGLTLRDRLAEGPITAVEAAAIGVQIAEGLAAAHGQQIIHRDLKPENIKITPSGLVKILDFGIARSTSQTVDSIMSTTPDATDGIIGTLPYMAPEQLRGDPVDRRADIFALGCVLYEMTTGRRPFNEPVAARLIDSILNRDPAAPRSIARAVPVHTQQVILKCLEKRPENRFGSAADVAAALRGTSRIVAFRPRHWIAAAGLAVVIAGAAVIPRYWSRPRTIGSIAVLPMENLSRDASQEYFADGMTDALITDIGRLSADTRVIARGSMMQYKGTHKPLPDIARELHVDAIVTGAVAREGDRVRVTAELVDPSTQTQLWSDHYDADLRNILTLQSDLASTIASKIRRTLMPAPKTAPPVSSEAFDAYMRAMSHRFRPTASELALRMQYAQLAVQKDPNFSLAHAAIAGTWAARIVYGFSSPAEALGPARAEAMRALELDPDSAEAHLALAAVRMYLEWNWRGAEREYRKAIELDPGSPDVRFQYATLLGPTLGRFDDWQVQIDRCLELDPLNPSYRYFRARHFMTLRKSEESIAAMQQLAKDTPDFPLLHEGFWYAYETTGRRAEALREAELSYEVKRDAAMVAALRSAHGDYPAAMRNAARILEERSRSKYVPSGSIARLYAYAGDKEEAMRWLQHAYDTHDQGMVTLKTAPSWDPLRGDPRFQELLRKLRFPT